MAKFVSGEILINHDYKLIYLPIFKNATSDLNLILLFYYDFIKIEFTKTNEENDFKFIYTNKVLEQYPEYFVFTVSRNPYTRYNSAIKYLNKLKDRLDDKLKHSLDKLKDPNLDVIFINNELNEKLTNYSKNHLDKQYYFYDKCQTILKIENLNEDLIKLLINRNIPIKHYAYLKKNKRLNNTNKFENILFNDELINTINIFYKEDFEVYNYKMIKTVEELEIYKNSLIIENIDEIYEKYKDYIVEQDIFDILKEKLDKLKDKINESMDDEFMNDENYIDFD